MRIIYILFIISLFSISTFCQTNYSLDDILVLARANSWSAEHAKMEYEIATHENLLLKAKLKPRFSLDAQIPNYFQTSVPITQPNGTIEFQRIAQNNSSFSLRGSQQIAATGGQVFLESNLRRFDDFTFDNRLYNGAPVRLGFYQPLFGFNALKWEKSILPIQSLEAEKTFSLDIENTQLQAVIMFFDILIATENNKISSLNIEVNERLLGIATERLKLGKISEDEVLQLKIELQNAEVDLRSSVFALERAQKNLWTFLGINSNPANFTLPHLLPETMINENEAIQKAIINRPEFIRFQKELAESDRTIDQTKKTNGIQANVFASFGLTRGAEAVSEIYQNPFSEQQLSLSANLPILDWGYRKTSIKQAQLKKEQLVKRHLQEKSEIEDLVRMKVREFHLMQASIRDHEQMRTLAEKRFTIANDRYVLGAISITDWTLAQREKDDTQRRYIQSLRDYWRSFYELRLLTGHDFITNRPITY